MTHRKDAIKNPTMKLKSIASLEEVPIKIKQILRDRVEVKIEFQVCTYRSVFTNPVKHLRWSFLRQYFFNINYFHKSSILDLWLGFEYASV